ncbi:hypothetical protein GCM10011344_23590 [Dokdonia pacifica]|uniref:Uncharacterized protein n=1 Tax=Dokdonia pacifica TaxID=1627892 RepID=A0A238WNF2_9FLAO|nr:hypothetical protein [Dokdonia pacifica]GGG22151.1 hypothetical protein GCM10011344_23590 [Dokdonia pacifica]SNR47209.1 hypothetical protein SAMN06265376_1011189 [Dokdonia pacifica]
MLKNMSTLGITLDKADQKKIAGGLPPLIPNVCGGTGGKRTNYSQAQCFGYGYSWEYGACYICY